MNHYTIDKQTSEDLVVCFAVPLNARQWSATWNHLSEMCG